MKQTASRQCALTREIKPRDELIRFVVGPDGQIVADLKQTLPGRGVWITCRKNCVKEAIDKKVFHRHFAKQAAGQKIIVSDELFDQIERIFADRILGLLKMAKKSGNLVFGYEKCNQALDQEHFAKRPIVALIHAKDGSSKGRERLDRKFFAVLGKKNRLNSIILFSNEQLSLAFGRNNVIHAGLLAGGVSQAAQEMIDKYLIYLDEQ